MSVDLLCLILGLAIGFATGWFALLLRNRIHRTVPEEQFLGVKGKFHGLQIEFDALQIELAKANERAALRENTLETAKRDLAQERQFNLSMHAELSRERTSRSFLEQNLEQQKAGLIQLQQRLSQDIVNLTREVLEEKSKSLDQMSQTHLHHLLQPISVKLQEFKEKIEEQHDRETRELIILHNKLANLAESRRLNSEGHPSPTSPLLNGILPRVTAPVSELKEGPAAPPESADPEESERSVVNGAHPEKLIDHQGFENFFRKQQVELDNFLKRTLGRARRKKPSA
jgi:hypothetical protein